MIAVLALGLLAVAPPTEPPATEVTPTFVSDPAGLIRIPRPDGSDLIVVEPGEYGFGAEAGDTIVVRFPGSDGLEEAKFQADCDDWGGHLVWTTLWTGGHYGSGAGEFACEDVDF